MKNILVHQNERLNENDLNIIEEKIANVRKSLAQISNNKE